MRNIRYFIIFKLFNIIIIKEIEYFNLIFNIL